MSNAQKDWQLDEDHDQAQRAEKRHLFAAWCVIGACAVLHAVIMYGWVTRAVN